MVPIEAHPYLGEANLPAHRRKVYIETYGCQMNVSDTEVARSVLQGAGYDAAESLEDADVALMMTCAIREGAERRVFSRLDAWRAARKKMRRPELTLGLLGCMAERLKEKLLEGPKPIDLVCGPDAYRDLPRLLDGCRAASAEGHSAGGQMNVQLSLEETYADITPVRTTPGSPSAFVSVMRGCDNMCTYCIVPFTRGRERSRDLESVVREVSALSQQGVREVTLLGQNVNSYRDLSNKSTNGSTESDLTPRAAGFSTVYKVKSGGRRFAELLTAVAEVNPLMRVRFTSPHPKDFPDEVLQVIQDTPNVCAAIHLPAQSGSSAVLDRMGRGYTREAYLDLVTHIRNLIPGVTLSSDFIAGFCGETEEDHRQTVSLLEEVRFDMAYLFAYSLRERTRAHRRFEDDVPEETKKRRLQELIATFHAGALAANTERIGSRQTVLVEGSSRRSEMDLVGRTEGNIKVVFPAISVDAPSGPARQPAVGDYVDIRVGSTSSLTLQGTALRIVA